MTSPVPPSPVSCADVVAALPAYRAGTLAADIAWPLEVHAAHCAACEALLDTGGSLPSALPTPDATTQSAMRHDVLTRMRAARRPHTRWRRAAPWAVLAAAAVLTVMFLPERRLDVTRPTDTSDAFDVTSSAPMVSALKLAESQAVTEFAALDVAERELNASLAVAPDDIELRRFHDTIEARRRELSQRVSSVTE